MSPAEARAASWGERWLAMASGGRVAARRRLERGRAGAGRLVETLRIRPGEVRVRVPDGRGRSHDVTIAVPPLDDDDWREVVGRVSGAVRHTAALLDGDLPAVLARDDLLLPRSVAETCTCAQERPCRHVAAAHHGIAAALERDPLRLLRVRGRSADELRDALRAARGGGEAATEAHDVDLADPLVARGDLAAVDVHPVPEPDVATVFEQLGPPPGFDDEGPVATLMRQAARMAWRLAAGEGAEVADDEALLTELRSQGVATAGSIAASLGLDPAVAQDALDRLYGEGQVLRMGAGDAARYRAA